MKPIIGIYKIVSPSGRIYIGQSVNVKYRFSKYYALNCKEQPLLYRSLKKYGADSHHFEILCECSKSELDQKEKYYIELFKTFNSKNGLNLQNGGYNRFSFSDSVRKKQSETRKRLGIKPPVHYGEANVNYGKPVPEERKQKQKEKLKLYHLRITPEEKNKQKKNLSKAIKRRWLSNPNWRIEKYGKENHRSKAIIQLTKEGDFIKEWENARQASSALKLNFKNISRAIHRNIRCGNFKWQFKQTII